ncbi:hypothetical protein HDV01_004951 [Terramyces sp. JEL0728]|nr:hypothetical protein HDV01_004951 [Terramyces sp. JEL0728]
MDESHEKKVVCECGDATCNVTNEAAPEQGHAQFPPFGHHQPGFGHHQQGFGHYFPHHKGKGKEDFNNEQFGHFGHPGSDHRGFGADYRGPPPFGPPHGFGHHGRHGFGHPGRHGFGHPGRHGFGFGHHEGKRKYSFPPFGPGFPFGPKGSPFQNGSDSDSSTSSSSDSEPETNGKEQPQFDAEQFKQEMEKYGIAMQRYAKRVQKYQFKMQKVMMKQQQYQMRQQFAKQREQYHHHRERATNCHKRAEQKNAQAVHEQHRKIHEEMKKARKDGKKQKNVYIYEYKDGSSAPTVTHQVIDLTDESDQDKTETQRKELEKLSLDTAYEVVEKEKN